MLRQTVHFINLAHDSLAELAGDLIMAWRFADHKETLHVDSRCNAMKNSSEVGDILVKLDNAEQ